MKKKFLITAALSAVLLLSSHAFADGITVMVNGKPLDTESVIINDRTLVPLRAISEALDCDVAWDGDTKGINIYRDDNLYNMWIGCDIAFNLSENSLSGYYDMDSPPIVINDRTMLPLRAIGELLGANVGWDDETKTASITLAESTFDNTGMAQTLLPYEAAIKENYEVYKKYVHGELHTVNVEITLENNDVIKAELYPEIAPKTVDNFVNLAEKEFYDGLIFHRIIDGFVIQGGGYTPGGDEPETSAIEGEFTANGFLNPIPHTKGTLSMARTIYPNSATSQFFITVADTPSLNGNYAAFGKVTSGMDIVESLAKTQTDENDKPLKDIVIKSIRIQK